MFSVIYSFEVNPQQEAAFVAAWHALTQAIYVHCGSLGSRLHKDAEGRYLAYAQWPSRAHWKNPPELPVEAVPLRENMRALCAKVEVLHELEWLSDLIQTSPAKS